MIPLDLLQSIQRLANVSPNLEAFKEQLRVMIAVLEQVEKGE